MRFGLYSNCAKYGPTNSRTDSCNSTETRSLSRCGFGCEGDGKPANPHCLSQSVAERYWERWVGSCRRELLDHVLNERHLKRLMSLYLLYYHEDRTHLGLGKDTPVGRVAASVSPSENKIISWPRRGGLHHRYTVAA